MAAVSDEWRDHPDVGQHEPDLRACRPRASITSHCQPLRYDLPRARPARLEAIPRLVHGT